MSDQVVCEDYFNESDQVWTELFKILKHSIYR